MMNMDKLLPSEIMQIDGAGWRSNMAEFVDTGSVIGTVIGYAPTGTLIGAGLVQVEAGLLERLVDFLRD
ncbi:MAG TPA: hypothetical protein ACQGQJ_09315 [Xylella fastidiosa subsp. multiplex]